MTRLRVPEGGTPPPATETLPDGASLPLRPLAERVTELYFAEFADDVDRYGDAGRAWCIHDTQYLLAWLLQEARLGTPIFEPQVRWLAELLGARCYPLERLARHLELLADEVEESVEDGSRLAALVRAVEVET